MLRRAARLVVIAAGLAFAAGRPAAAQSLTGSPGPRESGRQLRSGEAAVLPRVVPFIAQGPDLCGGASLAMVLRYWGATRVYAEDYEPLVSHAAGGIRAGDLEAAARRPGWRAVAFAGTLADLTGQIAAGRPVIALIRLRPGHFHYVVVTALEAGRVRFEDPAVAPDRERSVADFLSQWQGSGSWCLVLTPDPNAAGKTATPAEPTPPPPAPSAPPTPLAPGPGRYGAGPGTPAGASPCDSLVDAGVRLAREGRAAAADSALASATSRCPGSSRPARELAGLRFKEQRWRDASRLAGRAVAATPGDTLAWQLLAASRFMADDPSGALSAWNAVDEPRVDLVQIEGLRLTRYPALVRYLDLEPRTLLTPSRLSRAERRLDAFPAVEDGAVRFEPGLDGDAQVDASVLERQSGLGLHDLLGLGPHAVGAREIRPVFTSPTGGGERLDAAWRWEKARPLLGLRLLAAAPFDAPGVVRLEGYRERESYRGPGTADRVPEETRRRTSLGWSDWFSGSLRLGGSLAYDHWDDRGGAAAAGIAIEARLGDHLRGSLESEAWSLGSGVATAHARAGWSPLEPGGRYDLDVHSGLEAAGAEAPLALVPGAGLGQARQALLRAHPLLHDGILDGPVFGRRLLDGGVEGTWWAMRLPASLGLAAFVDAAQAWDSPLTGADPPGRIDAGLGIRVRLPQGGTLHLDAAWGLSDRAHALSVTATPWKFS